MNKLNRRQLVEFENKITNKIDTRKLTCTADVRVRTVRGSGVRLPSSVYPLDAVPRASQNSTDPVDVSPTPSDVASQLPSRCLQQTMQLLVIFIY